MVFKWQNSYYKFLVLPNGLCSGPRIFVRMSKAISAHLRKYFIDILIYIDDSLLCAQSYTQLIQQRTIALQVFKKCGFTINEKKSSLQPCKKVDFLGFALNSEEFSIELLHNKCKIIKKFAQKLLTAKLVSIRQIAKMIGLCVATFPATKHGQLHYRTMERFKVKMLVLCGGKWNKKVRLSHKCCYEIIWWMNNITTRKFKRFLAEKQVDHELSTDSCKTGWGCCLNEK